MIIAQKLDLPIYGVDLPNFLILAYSKNYIENAEPNDDLRRWVVFYMNPQKEGTIFTRNEIKIFLRKANLENQTKFFVPGTNAMVMRNYLETLIKVYEEAGSTSNAEELRSLLPILE